jgi:hypothetical protein
MTEGRNLKNAAAAGKPPITAVPMVALLALGAAMQDGANKYEKFNWRDTEVDTDVFLNAIFRHFAAWSEGEEFAPDSGVHHLAHIMAGCAILIDAQYTGVLVDKRNITHTNPVTNGRQYWERTKV